MVLVTKNVGEDGITLVRLVGVCNQTHCNTRYRLLDFDTCVHKRKASAANAGH